MNTLELLEALGLLHKQTSQLVHPMLCIAFPDCAWVMALIDSKTGRG